MALRRDIAPGQNHITLRKWGRSFYAPQLFHLAPTADRVVPLAIRDVLRAKTMLEVYGVQGLEEHAKGCVLVNNFPVRTVKVFGRVMSYIHKNYDSGWSNNPNNFYVMTLDDCSGEVSHINVKIPESCVYEQFEEDSIVQVVGHVLFFQDYLRQIVGDKLDVLSLGPDLSIEIDCWREILTARRHLRHPWTYKPETVLSTGSSREPKFSKKDYLRRLEKQNLRISDPSSQAPQTFHVTDSFNHNNIEGLEVLEVHSDSDAEPSFSSEQCIPQLHTFHQEEPDQEHSNDTDIDDDETTIPFPAESHIIVLD